MSSIASFFLRLVGADPEQKEAEHRFRESLRKSEETDEQLDEILGSLKQVNTKVRRNRELTRTMIPEACTDEHPIVPAGES